MRWMMFGWTVVYVVISAATGFAQSPRPAAPLLVQESGWKFDSFKPVGKLANPDEICAVFDHPIFNRDENELSHLDSINSDLDWDGIELAPLWIEEQFKTAGISIDRLFLRQDTLTLANQNLSLCIRARSVENYKFYNLLAKYFLHYLDEKCYENDYRIERSIDDAGNLIEKKVVTSNERCIDFDYNSGRYTYWNSTTLALMLVWAEAHPVLLKIFDRGENVLVARLAEAKARQEEQARAEQNRQREMLEKRAAEEIVWQTYTNRPKTILEEVYNFASTGNPNGEKYKKWTEIEKCVMSDGASIIDNRKINMTAFRIYRDFIGALSLIVSSDRAMKLSTSANIPIDRLQNAWGIAFRECPGVTSRF